MKEEQRRRVQMAFTTGVSFRQMKDNHGCQRCDNNTGQQPFSCESRGESPSGLFEGTFIGAKLAYI